VRALAAIAAHFRHDFEFVEAPVGAAAMDAGQEPLPPATLALASSADAVLFGAIGSPRHSDPAAKVRPEQAILGLRHALGLFANLRPVLPQPALHHASPLKDTLLQGVDLLIVRELTGGIYFGRRVREADAASDECRYSVAEVERIARVAFRLAGARRGRVTSVDKANVLETSRLWREVVTRVAREEFPAVGLEHQLVDSAAMLLLTRPASFDVLVTENLFGDILSDEAAALAGSLGLMPSASLGEGSRGLYEPIHGSAPDIAGQNKANPLAAILSVAMLFEHTLKNREVAQRIERAANAVLEAGLRTPDLMRGDATGKRLVGTREMGDAVIAQLGG